MSIFSSPYNGVFFLPELTYPMDCVMFTETFGIAGYSNRKRSNDLVKLVGGRVLGYGMKETRSMFGGSYHVNRETRTVTLGSGSVLLREYKNPFIQVAVTLNQSKEDKGIESKYTIQVVIVGKQGVKTRKLPLEGELTFARVLSSGFWGRLRTYGLEKLYDPEHLPGDYRRRRGKNPRISMGDYLT
jgi:hypothetical protein